MNLGEILCDNQIFPPSFTTLVGGGRTKSSLVKIVGEGNKSKIAVEGCNKLELTA